jgi:hypothetical protein
MQSMSIRSCVRWLGPGTLSALTLASCSGDSPAGPAGDRGPTIAAIADQTVIRNTIDARGVDVPLEIEAEADNAVTVRVDSDDEDVIAGTSFNCVLSDPCVLSLTPAADRTAVVNLEVTVSGSGEGEARTSFRLNVLPRMVTTEEDNFPGSLRERIGSADPGDVVGFDTGGFFGQPRTVRVIAQIVIDRPLTIEGPGADALTVSGTGSTRVFRIASGADVVISGLRVADGLAAAESWGGEPIHAGGGILVELGGRLTLSASTVSDSDAAGGASNSYGGGIANIGGTLIVRDGSRITGNHALSAGGGIASSVVSGVGGRTTITNSLIDNNTAVHGGGVHADGRELFVEASTITGNTAFIGGGVYVARGEAVVDASTIAANTAVDAGGGLRSTGRETIIRNGTVIEGNEAWRGGGLYMSGVFTIEAGTEIRGNVAEEDGGGLHYRGGSPVPGAGVTVVIDASTIQDNSAQRGGGIFYTYSHGTSGSFTVLHIRNGSRIGLNVAETGGGIFQTQNFGGSGNTRTLIDASEIVGNTATGPVGGGGIMNEGGRITIRSGSSIALNTAMNGGGIFTRENTVEAREVVTDILSGTVTENTATLAGGGVLNRMVLILRSGASITGNEALATSGSGGGVYNIGSFTNGGSVTGNSPDDVAP